MGNKILNEEQLTFYREQGYVLAKGVVPLETIQLARTVLERWCDETIAGWVSEGLLDDPMADVGFSHRLVQAWNAAGQPRYIRSPRKDLVSREMFDYLRHPALLDLAEDLLGTGEILAHGIFNGRPKLPSQRWTNTPWHQDAQYYRDAADVHVVSIWVPLQPVNAENSCLQVAGGYHRGELHENYHDEESGFTGLSPEITRDLTGIPISMEVGDALCFTQLTPHGALPNNTDAVRWSMDVRYEALPGTAVGNQMGFVARSANTHETTFDEWLEKWQAHEGAY